MSAGSRLLSARLAAGAVSPQVLGCALPLGQAIPAALRGLTVASVSASPDRRVGGRP